MTNPIIDVSSYIIALQDGKLTPEIRSRAKVAIEESADAREPVRLANNIIHVYATKYRNEEVAIDAALDSITSEFNEMGITYYDMSIEREPLKILITMEKYVFGNSFNHVIKAYDIMDCADDSKIKICYAYTVLRELLNYDINFDQIDMMKTLNAYLKNREIDQIMLLTTKLVYELVLYRGLNIGN